MKKTVLRRIMEIVGYVVIVAIASLLMFVIISNVKGQTVFIAGRTTAWVLTPSMEPEIPARSYILVRQVDPSEIREGDVIMFKSDDPSLHGANNTHRVVKVLNNHTEFETKGDANNASDLYTARAENVLGVYERRLPVLTALGRFLSSGIGIMVVVAVILGIIMLMYLPGIINANRKRAKELEDKHNEQIEERVREEVERLKREKIEQLLAELKSSVANEQETEREDPAAEAVSGAGAEAETETETQNCPEAVPVNDATTVPEDDHASVQNTPEADSGKIAADVPEAPAEPDRASAESEKNDKASDGGGSAE